MIKENLPTYKVDKWVEIPATDAFIGFDEIFNKLAGIGPKDIGVKSTYPPYNLIRTSDTSHLIEIAAAGFSPEDLSVSIENNQLTIEGKVSQTDDKNYVYRGEVHRGIAKRNFSLVYKLAEYSEITAVEYLNGLLSIKIEKIIPDANKPKVIPIGFNANTKTPK
jgi:molecular chaperone IbpA